MNIAEKLRRNKIMQSIGPKEVISKDLINYIFRGSPFYPLDNFWECPVLYDGIYYLNSEAAFQSAKTLDRNTRMKMSFMSASESKMFGKDPKKMVLRPDWNDVKDEIMYEIVKDKMTRNPLILELLKSTGSAIIIEGNYWRDNYWGIEFGSKEGYNMLGTILMMLREEFKDHDTKLSKVKVTAEQSIWMEPRGKGFRQVVGTRYKLKGWSEEASKWVEQFSE